MTLTGPQGPGGARPSRSDQLAAAFALLGVIALTTTLMVVLGGGVTLLFALSVGHYVDEHAAFATGGIIAGVPTLALWARVLWSVVRRK